METIKEKHINMKGKFYSEDQVGTKNSWSFIKLIHVFDEWGSGVMIHDDDDESYSNQAITFKKEDIPLLIAELTKLGEEIELHDFNQNIEWRKNKWDNSTNTNRI